MRRACLSAVFLLIAGVFCTGCSNDPNPPAPPPSGNEAGADSAADAAAPEGKDATVGGGGDASAPDGSDAALPKDGCAKAETLRTSCEATFPDKFDQSTVLAKGCYRAAKTPTIGAGVTLTLSAGVTIIFAQTAGLRFSGDQSLVVAGTAEEPVCLTGSKAERGVWRGVELGRTEGTAANKLDWVTVEYAGDTTTDTDPAAIKLVSDSRPVAVTLSHTTLRESKGWGLWLIGSAQIGGFANNTFTKNTKGPVSADSNVTGALDAASAYKGNDLDQVAVRANRIQDQKMATWAALEVPYYVDANLTTEVEWLISAGATVIVSKGSEILVSGNAAALTADGTAQKPILITGEKAERGNWGGIIFTNAANAKNRMSYVTVEHAGDGVGQDDVADVVLTGTGSPTSLQLSHCTLRESKGYGLSLYRMAALPGFDANTFTKNTKGPVWAASEITHLLLPSSAYTGNDVDQVTVYASHIPGDFTWQDLGVPYAMLPGVLKPDKVWTVAPGVTLVMPKDSEISVDGDAAGFHAVGTAAKPVVITGADKTPGSWHGISYGTTLNAANSLEYATVEYGGGGQAAGNAAMINALADSHGVVLNVKNSKVQHSGQWGIRLAKSAQVNGDIETANTFTDNASGKVLRDP